MWTEFIWITSVCRMSCCRSACGKNYGIEQKEELPEYDYCYCDTCRALFKAKTGQDPLELKYPMENQSWINFRLDAVTHVVEAITKAVKSRP